MPLTSRFLSRALASAVVLLTAAGSATAQTSTEAERFKAHVTFLASDLLQGREAGTPGYDIAANYVASQLAQLGVQPAGSDGSYFQPVAMAGFRTPDEGRFVLATKAGDAPLVFGEDYIPGRNPLAAETTLSAPLVFVGYGVVAGRRDDYAGLNVKGAIVVALSGAPSSFQTEERAYYASAKTKRLEAEKRGAVGYIVIPTPSEERRRPFAGSVRSVKSWSMTWKDAQGQPFAPAGATPQVASLSVAGATKLFAGAPRTYAAVAAIAEAGRAPPRFVLPGSLSLNFTTEFKAVESANVVGLIPGVDPVLKDQAVVLSAHLDHIGAGAPGVGDTINNGAMDNATGVATTLEVARAFLAAKPPRRTVVFLLNTAEEKGLVGADYFAHNPPMPQAMVADINLDMPVLTYDFVDVVAFGAERSTMGAAVRRAAGRMNVGLSPDPMPEEGLFTRSDHFRFVERGVPSIFLMTGFQNGGEVAFRGFMKDHYHKPTDDLSQPIHYEVGAKFMRLNYEIAREIVDADEKPAWTEGDFFGELFGQGR